MGDDDNDGPYKEDGDYGENESHPYDDDEWHDAQEDWQDDGWYGDDGPAYDDDYDAWFGNEHKTAEDDAIPAAIGTGDADDEEALIAYMEARKNLKERAKRRGFVPNSVSPKIEQPEFTRPPSSSGYSSDGRRRTRFNPRSSSPFRAKGKGKGKSKGKSKSRSHSPGGKAKGKSRGKSGGHRPPARAKGYLAYAVVAVSTWVQAIDRVLRVDKTDEYEAEEQAYLASVPGFGVIDCGCTRSR